MRLIDADALNMAFTMLRFNEDGTLRHWGDRQNWCLSGQEVEDLINSIPTAEPKRKAGRWVGNPETCEFMTCSACGCEFDWVSEGGYPSNEWAYCPECGAFMGGDMDGDMPD